MNAKKPTSNKTKKRMTGDTGEDIAVNYLRKKGYRILTRNYLKKWGELDIVTQKNGIIYFVEVKTKVMNFCINNEEWYRPEDNLHRNKLMRIKRTIQTYLIEKNISNECEWEFSAITVILKRKTHTIYKIEHLENLII